MLEIDKKTRDEIVRFLQSVVVPANIGAGLMQVAEVLTGLKGVEKEEVEEKKEPEKTQ